VLGLLVGVFGASFFLAHDVRNGPASAMSSASWSGNGFSESSSGSLFRAVQVRTYTGPRLFVNWNKSDKLLKVASRKTCRNWAVTTSIFPPTKTVLQLSKLPNWCLVVAGDKKGPSSYNVSNVVYLTPEMQDAMPFETKRLLRWNHFGRKNLGFLYAVQHGARWIYDTDDDNELKRGGPNAIPLLNGAGDFVDEVATNYKLYNLYAQLASNKEAWPRGFPLEAIKDNRTYTAAIRRRVWQVRRVGVLQSLADNDPDVDGIYRLTQRALPFSFPFRSSMALRSSSSRNVQPEFNADDRTHIPTNTGKNPSMNQRRRDYFKRAAIHTDGQPHSQSGLSKNVRKERDHFNHQLPERPAAGRRLAQAPVKGARKTLSSLPKERGSEASRVAYRGYIISLRKGTMMPYNAQATLHAYRSFWGLLLPCTVHGRVTDIWRSYFTQRMLWDLGMRIAFAAPWVTQYRNAHNLLGDFNSEVPLYQQAGALVDALLAWRPQSDSVPGRLEELYIFMYERTIIGLGDVQLAQAWLNDLVGLGYSFPML